MSKFPGFTSRTGLPVMLTGLTGVGQGGSSLVFCCVLESVKLFVGS
jgi:hypothetical protein